MSSNRVDFCLNLPAPDRATGLLGLREDQWFERKSIRVTARRFAEALTALANAEGGIVVVGLSQGRVEDIDAETKQVNELRRAPMSLTSPPVRTHFEELSVVDTEGSPATLLVARVSPGETVHEMSNGDVYLRVGDSSVKLGPAERQELLYDRGSSHYEARALAGVSMADLDVDLLGHFRDAIGAGPDSPFERQLHARSLLTSSEEVTVGAYLLFAPNPGRLFPHAHVRVLRYDSTARGTGAHQALLDGGDIRLEASIPRVIDEASRLIDAWVPRRRALQGDGRFAATPIVPRDAWLEGLVNAVVHRSYSAAGDHIRVEIFPDRIEIESPGRFPGIVNPERPLDITRYARNPRIARVCADLAITQELGEGIRRIFDEMRAHGLSDPVYQQTAGSVRLTLAAIARLDPRVQTRLPRGANTVLQALRAAGQPLGTGQIADAVQRSRPWVLRVLTALREEELVEWRGNSARDPRATWQLRGL
ncbi:hypothetical protein NPS01_40320 [Nocardioides psychrotolerans]|uniref:ATP-dependent DNA helicase RecG n=1 Tax=Nocardioides psychrotolerans TaxID=1005945 RepID=A0A1I3IV99_9ACTN|nr:ATP-binding protein [Nocardioides psychrotolerans]GEP40369.1 hypothetical protein NPS01_40320 [Nocardioides psychrotolerans]SFI51856.1 ATP-dependent DNA helicase RecG [Nocardioides psychrotolerans]